MENIRTKLRAIVERARQQGVDMPVVRHAWIETLLNEFAALQSAHEKLETAATSCTWTRDADDEAFETDCGRAFALNDGTPASNDLSFCCFCGGSLNESEGL